MAVVDFRERDAARGVGLVMIEDGDIGYAGDYHESFRAKPVARVGGRATAAGTEACRALVASLAAKFPAAHESMSERRAVTPERYWAAISRVVRGFA